MWLLKTRTWAGFQIKRFDEMTRRCIHDIGCILFWIRSENVIIPSFLWIFRSSVKSIFLLTLPSHFSILAQEDIYASCCPWPEIDRNFIFVFNEIFKNAGKNFNKCYKSHFGNNHYDNFLISSRLISSPLHAFQFPSWSRSKVKWAKSNLVVFAISSQNSNDFFS